MKKYQIVAKLDVKKIPKYRGKLWSMGVILTVERREHINRDHPELFNKIIRNLRMVIENPGWIYESEKLKHTLYFVRFVSSGYQIVVVRLSIRHDDKKQIRCSIITSWITNRKYVAKFARKNRLVYTGRSEK